MGSLENTLEHEAKQAKREAKNLTVIVPDEAALGNLKEILALLNSREEIADPELAGFVADVLAKVAIGLPHALKRDATDPARKRYVDFLQNALGFQVTTDAAHNRILVSFNLQSLVERLVTFQNAQLKIAIAA